MRHYFFDDIFCLRSENAFFGVRKMSNNGSADCEEIYRWLGQKSDLATIRLLRSYEVAKWQGC